MTKCTPHCEHDLLPIGTSVPHAPHSPMSSSATPENETPQLGQDDESIGITARQAPHSAMSTSESFELSSSPVKPTPIEPLLDDDITVQSGH